MVAQYAKKGWKQKATKIQREKETNESKGDTDEEDEEASFPRDASFLTTVPAFSSSSCRWCSSFSSSRPIRHTWHAC